MLSNGLVLIVFLSGKHTATSKHISTSVEAKQQHNEKERNNKCTCFITLRISSSQTCKCQSLKRAGVKATLHQHCTSQPTEKPLLVQNVLRAITGSGYQPAMRGAAPCCKCSRNPCHSYIFKAAPSPPPPPHPHYLGQWCISYAPALTPVMRMRRRRRRRRRFQNVAVAWVP